MKKLFFDFNSRIFDVFLLVGIVCLQSSCNAQDVSNKASKSLQSGDSIVRDIPQFFLRKEWLQYFTDLQASLNINQLQNGVEDWETRLWVAHSVYDDKDSSQLIVLKRENQRYSGTLYTYITRQELKPGAPVVLSAGRFLALLPESGWDRFIDSLKKLDFQSLPNYKNIKGYSLSNGSFGVTIETATNKSYKIIELPDYETRVHDTPEAARLLKILQYFEKEFKIKLVY